MTDPAPLRWTDPGPDRSLILTLASNSTRNALSKELFAALEVGVSQAEAAAREDRIDAVLLRAEGRAFCAGFDLAESAAEGRTLVEFVERLSALVRRLRDLDAIVVASVQGPALAGGCALVAAADIVIASMSATFGYPVHRIGVSPAVSLPTLLASAGIGGARLLALGGEMVTAERALALGIVHRVVPDEHTLRVEEVATLAGLAAKGRVALRETKRWLNRVDGTSRHGALGSRSDEAARATADLCAGEEARSMLAAVWAARHGAPRA